jgi:hypothetical protein
MESDDAARALSGAWHLRLYEDRDTADEPWTPTFGTRPSGVVVYGPGDLLSVGVFAGEDADSGWTHVAYLGTFHVREAGMVDDAIVGIVEHHMRAASHPELLGEGPDRPFTIQGDDLMLGDGLTSRRVFTRVAATP